MHNLLPPLVKELSEKLPWPGKDVGHQKCCCVFPLIYGFHQRNPRDSAPDKACNLQPQNLNSPEGEKVGVWKFISKWLLNPIIGNLKGSFQAASEKDSSGTLLYCKKLLAELLSRKEVVQKIKCGRIIDAFKLETWL